jgi:hypothetical protein
MSEPVAKRRPMIDLDEFERRLRQPSTANRSAENDPLAELARLVGGQDDPYKSMFGAQNDEPTGTHAGALPGEPDANERLISGDFEAIEAALLGARRQTPFDDLEAEEPSREVLSHITAPEPDHWSYEDAPALNASGHEPEDEARSKRPLYLMAAIIILGIGGIGASFVLKTTPSGRQEIATIKAAEGPVKIQPEVAEEKPVQDATVLNNSAQTPPAALAESIEQPVDLAVPPPKAPRVIPLDSGAPTIDQPVAGAASVPLPVPPAPVAPGKAQEQTAPTTIAGLIEPRKVKTVSVRPDGTLIPNENAPSPALPPNDAPVPTRQPADVPMPAPRPNLPAAKAATPRAAERVATTTNNVAQTPAPLALAPQANAPTAPARSAGTGSYAVQLAAPSTEEEARTIQVRLLKKHAAELAGFRTSIRRAVVGDRTVYRVRVGGLTQEEANVLCQKVQSAGSACFVARN